MYTYRYGTLHQKVYVLYLRHNYLAFLLMYILTTYVYRTPIPCTHFIAHNSGTVCLYIGNKHWLKTDNWRLASAHANVQRIYKHCLHVGLFQGSYRVFYLSGLFCSTCYEIWYMKVLTKVYTTRHVIHWSPYDSYTGPNETPHESLRREWTRKPVMGTEATRDV